jgi:hypothetical protein
MKHDLTNYLIDIMMTRKKKCEEREKFCRVYDVEKNLQELTIV